MPKRWLIGVCLLLCGGLAVQAQSTPSAPLQSLTTQYPNIAQIGYSADGRYLLSSAFVVDEQGTLASQMQVWDSASAQSLTTLQQEGQTLLSFAVHPSAPLLITGALEGTVTLWSMGAEAGAWNVLNSAPAHDGLVRLQFSADGTRFISYDAQSILLWSSADFTPQWVLGFPSDLGEPVPLSMAALSRDGQRIAGVYGDQVLIYDSQTGAVVQRFSTGYALEPYQLFFSMEGANLALAYQFLEVRSVQDGSIVGQFSGNSDIVVAEVDSTWTRLATAELEGRVLLWDVLSQTVLSVVLESDAFVWDMAFAPPMDESPRVLAVARGEGRVEFYSLP